MTHESTLLRTITAHLEMHAADNLKSWSYCWVTNGTYVFVLHVHIHLLIPQPILILLAYTHDSCSYAYRTRSHILTNTNNSHPNVITHAYSVDPLTTECPIRRACIGKHVEIVKLLLDKRVVITNDLLHALDLNRISNCSSMIDCLFEAGYPRIWPRVIGNDIDCIERKDGHLRHKLDGLEINSSWLLLLCVKRIFTKRVAARVGDVLRDVCSEWTRYLCREVSAKLYEDPSNPKHFSHGYRCRWDVGLVAKSTFTIF